MKNRPLNISNGRAIYKVVSGSLRGYNPCANRAPLLLRGCRWAPIVWGGGVVRGAGNGGGMG